MLQLSQLAPAYRIEGETIRKVPLINRASLAICY
jgi:hypothetical protein